MEKHILDSKLITDTQWEEYQQLKQETKIIKEKYNKALELLIDYNMPCEMDDFMNVFSDFCSRNCSVDEEQFKSCWDLFIEWKCKNTTKTGGE